jgi:hypothetical protein
VLCVVRKRSLRRADHSSRGVLPTVVRRCVWSRNLVNEEALAQWGRLRQKQTKILSINQWSRTKEMFTRVTFVLKSQWVTYQDRLSERHIGICSLYMKLALGPQMPH